MKRASPILRNFGMPVYFSFWARLDLNLVNHEKSTSDEVEVTDSLNDFLEH